MPLLFGKLSAAKFGKIFSSLRMMRNPYQPDFNIAVREPTAADHRFKIKYQ